MKTKRKELADLVGLAAVVLSLLFLAYEIRQSNRIARSTISYELGNNTSQLDQLVWTNSEVAALQVRIRDPAYVPTVVEEEMLRAQARRFLTVWGAIENAYRNGHQTRGQLEILLEDVEAVLRAAPAARHLWKDELDQHAGLGSYEFYRRARGVVDGPQEEPASKAADSRLEEGR